jgi:hypothetical protein
MKKRIRQSVSALGLLALLAHAAAGQADPLVIQTGNVEGAVSVHSAIVKLYGNDFSLEMVSDDYGTAAAVLCQSCSPGTSATIGADVAEFAAGMLVADGTDYNTLYPELTVDFAGSFSTPQHTLPQSGPVTVQLPFTFSGSVRAFGDPSGGPPVVSARELSGTGVVTARFDYFDSPNADPPYYYLSDTQLFDFGPAPSTVPEPASLLLVATGVLVGGRGLRRRR